MGTWEAPFTELALALASVEQMSVDLATANTYLTPCRNADILLSCIHFSLKCQQTFLFPMKYRWLVISEKMDAELALHLFFQRKENM